MKQTFNWSCMARHFTSIDCVDGILHRDTVIAEVFLHQDSSVVVDLESKAAHAEKAGSRLSVFLVLA